MLSTARNRYLKPTFVLKIIFSSQGRGGYPNRTCGLVSEIVKMPVAKSSRESESVEVDFLEETLFEEILRSIYPTRSQQFVRIMLPNPNEKVPRYLW